MRQAVRLTLPLAIVVTLLTIPVAGSAAAPVRVADLQTEVRGTVYEATDASQMRAEEIFATAEAAVYFPDLRRVRWLALDGSVRALGTQSAVGVRTVREFDENLERDFPRFRSGAHGPFLLKQPAMTERLNPAAHIQSEAAVPLATVFTDSFESGMSNWTLDNNTLDLYSWGTTTCEARTGTRSADALRGGVNNLACNDAYGPNVITEMAHKNCEVIQGASQAWLDAYIHIGTELNADTIGFYYEDASGKGYGYAFSGSSGTWFHVVFNLKQWYRLGDVTAKSCPQVYIQFYSDAATESGFGARVDDLTISNATPSFLSASITATPTTGTVPLTVAFSPSITAASSAATYLWSFGDAAGSTATTRTASFTYATAGDYSARFRVDDTNARAYAHTIIHATAAVVCSVACTATVPSTATVGSAALFQATATATGCSGTAAYSWTFGDGQSSAAQNASHAYAAAGTYGWTLTTSISGTSCTKSGSITVSRSRLRAVSPPVPAAGYQVAVNPSTAAQTFTSGDLSVTIPGGLLTTAKTLKVTKLTTPPNPNFKGLGLGGAYDVSLGDMTHFDTAITIRLRYDPSRLRTDLPVNRAISAAWYDEKQGVWIETPAQIDSAKSEIVIGTNHLTKWGWFVWLRGYKVIDTDNFTVAYDDAELRDPLLGPVYNAPDDSNHVDPNVPDYIEDAVAYLEFAFHRYKAAGFKVPPTPINVYIGGSDASQRGKFFGHGLSINLNATTQPLLKLEIAHEVFHSFEGSYLTAVGMGTGEIAGVWAPPILSWSVWYIESAAEYAAEWVAWDGTLHLMGNRLRRDYLNYPISDVSENHEYGYSTAHFVRYLVQSGADFKGMSEYLFTYDWLNLNDYYYPLHEYLEKVRGSGNGLPRTYQAFARSFTFDTNSPMPPITDSLHSEVASYRTTMSGEPLENVTFDLAGGYTSKLWGIWFSDSLFTPANPKIKYTVSVVDTLPVKVEIDVYVLKGDKRVAGGGTPAGTLSQTTKSMQVEVEKGDAVYLLAVSSASTAQQAKVSIGTPIGAFGVKYSMTLRPQGAETQCYWGTDPVPSRDATATVSSLNWSGTAFDGAFDGPGDYGATKHVEVSGSASGDFKTLTSLTWKSVSRTEGVNPTNPKSNSRAEVTMQMTLSNLSQTSKSADGKKLVFSASGSELSKRLTSVSWDYVLDYYNLPMKYVCNRTIVDYASTDNPPAVEITLSQP